jgi:hypothetical protein
LNPRVGQVGETARATLSRCFDGGDDADETERAEHDLHDNVARGLARTFVQ